MEKNQVEATEEEIKEIEINITAEDTTEKIN